MHARAQYDLLLVSIVLEKYFETCLFGWMLGKIRPQDLLHYVVGFDSDFRGYTNEAPDPSGRVLI